MHNTSLEPSKIYSVLKCCICSYKRKQQSRLLPSSKKNCTRQTQIRWVTLMLRKLNHVEKMSPWLS
uniref:Uncharacterized protein n=1 Tax=Arundo donax TaxID=35708 RepID=A0A0A8YSF7_ARUDO